VTGAFLGAGDLAPVVGDQGAAVNAKPWVLQPVFDDFSALTPTWLDRASADDCPHRRVRDVIRRPKPVPRASGNRLNARSGVATAISTRRL
jgi:hypothetical protein